jgi:hypothetical protein
VLVRALQRDPKARYETAADFGRALSLLLPDPITARDEVVAFYRTGHALQEGLPLEIATREMKEEPQQASQGSIVGSANTPSSTTDATAPLWIVGALAAFAFALVVIFATILMVQTRWRHAPDVEPPQPRMADVVGAPEPEEVPDLAADEPPGPAGIGAPGEDEPPPVAVRGEGRPPPESSVPLPLPTSHPSVAPAEPQGPIVIVRKRDPDPTVVPVPAAATEPGFLTIGARQDAEVYLDGEFVRTSPIYHYEASPGVHVVTIQALDGRRKTFEVTVEGGLESRHVWDFDRGEWKR